MSLVHYITIGFFDLHADQLSPGLEPTPLRPLDRQWIEQRLVQKGPDAEEAFWFTESGCLWGLLSWLEIGQEIVDHHGSGCVVVHQNNGLVIYPAAGVAEQYRVNGWNLTVPETVSTDS